ncbi:MAG: DUF5908 family protein [Porphyromonadaceae bacterium]|nr:DUF5908 family protein [Porphyromonadaceae bacterium]
MPIEIKELHIRINVEESTPVAGVAAETTQSEKDKIIAACVEQVMEILSKKEER